MKKLVLMALLALFSLPAFAGDYIIVSGDDLKIDVWNVPEMGGEVTVRPDGKITLPAIGDVEVEGKSPMEVAKVLTTAVNQFVKAPVVTVGVMKITNNKIFVTGDGVINQVVTMPGRSTLFKFLAGVGTLEQADLRGSYVARGGKVVYQDFYRLVHDGDLTADFNLEADDIIFIPSGSRNKAYVVGAVKKPRAVTLTEGFSLLDAILSAEGFNPHADRESVFLVRQGEETKTVSIESVYKNPAENLKLKKGDYVVVPGFETDAVYVTGEVRSPQKLSYTKNMRVYDAISSVGGFTEQAVTSKVVVLGAENKKTVVNLDDIASGKNTDMNIKLNSGDHIIVGRSIF